MEFDRIERNVTLALKTVVFIGALATIYQVWSLKNYINGEFLDTYRDFSKMEYQMEEKIRGLEEKAFFL